MNRGIAIVTMLLTLSLAQPASGQAQEDPNKDAYELFKSGHQEEALALALQRLRDQPADRNSNQLAGRFLCEMGRPLEARPYLEKVVQAEERDWIYAWSLLYLGKVAFTQGDDQAAVAAWTEVRDGKLTDKVARSAANSLRYLALDKEFDDWIRLRTDSCIFAFSKQHENSDLQAFADEHERAYAELTEYFGGKTPWPVRYIVWGSVDEAKELCGIKDLGFADPKNCIIHCRWDQTVGHELTHVVSFQALKPTERTRLINEGLAVLFDLTGRDRLEFARQAVAAENLTDFDLAQWWQDASQTVDESFYPIAGAWLKTLLERGGKEKLIELCRNQTLAKAREIYGEDLDLWMREFKEAVLGPS